MIRNIYLLAVLCLILSNIAYTQAPRCRSLDTSTGVLGAAEDLPTNAIADDFGPRNVAGRGGNVFFHAGMVMVQDMNDPLVWRYTQMGFGVRAEECHGFTIEIT